MNYTLNKSSAPGESKSDLSALKRLLPLLKQEKRELVIAMIAVVFNAGSSLVAPAIIAYAVDHFIRSGDYAGVLWSSLLLFVIFLVGLFAGYTQTMRMGGVGRRVLYNLRNQIFTKLQELPVAFFNQNKVGDLISRINNDTDRLNQFFGQALMQFLGSFFQVLGSAIFLLTLNIRLGVAALLPAVGVLIVSQLIGGWVKRKNLQSLQSLGGMSAEIQESLTNFKVIVAFNRLDYFREKFNQANDKNFKASISAGIANNVFLPIYTLASSLGQLIVLSYGIYLIQNGQVTIGLLVGFFLYVNSFYGPLRQLASIWSSFQQSLAALDRISEVLALDSDMPQMEASHSDTTKERAILSFHHVSFRYPEGKDVLKHISF